MKIDAIATTNSGQTVRIIGIDSDPTCEVMTVLLADPDTIVSVLRSELTLTGEFA